MASSGKESRVFYLQLTIHQPFFTLARASTLAHLGCLGPIGPARHLASWPGHRLQAYCLSTAGHLALCITRLASARQSVGYCPAAKQLQWAALASLAACCTSSGRRLPDDSLGCLSGCAPLAPSTTHQLLRALDARVHPMPHLVASSLCYSSNALLSLLLAEDGHLEAREARLVVVQLRFVGIVVAEAANDTRYEIRGRRYEMLCQPKRPKTDSELATRWTWHCGAH